MQLLFPRLKVDAILPGFSHLLVSLLHRGFGSVDHVVRSLAELLEGAPVLDRLPSHFLVAREADELKTGQKDPAIAAFMVRKQAFEAVRAEGRVNESLKDSDIRAAMGPGENAKRMNARFRETPDWTPSMWAAIKEYFGSHPELG